MLLLLLEELLGMRRLLELLWRGELLLLLLLSHSWSHLERVIGPKQVIDIFGCCSDDTVSLLEFDSCDVSPSSLF